MVQIEVLKLVWNFNQSSVFFSYNKNIIAKITVYDKNLLVNGGFISTYTFMETTTGLKVLVHVKT